MQCRCGNSLKNVPDHLKDLASWICQKCTNTAPKAQSLNLEISEVEIKKPAQRGRPKKIAA